MLFKMLRIFLTLALLAVVQCSFGGGLLHSVYYYEGESESESESSESSSESSSETSSEPPPCPCTPLDVGQCCDDCHYCKDENAVCDTYGYSKLCICKDGFIFDYECKKCVPDIISSTTETTKTTPTTPPPKCPNGSVGYGYGEACQDVPDNCCEDQGLECINGSCMCKMKLTYNPTEDKCCGNELGDPCCVQMGFDECAYRDSFSICDMNNGTCVCNSNAVPVMGFCVPNVGNGQG